MLTRICAIVAICAALIAATYPLKLQAQGFTNRDFLEKAEATQRWYVSSAADMAASIATLNGDNQGTCIWNWYFGDVEARFVEITQTMAEHPDNVPSAIIIGHIQRACGSLTY